MERILETAGKLVRWTRATDANNKVQTFGFAEFADAQSLETAAEIFQDVVNNIAWWMCVSFSIGYQRLQQLLQHSWRNISNREHL